ncbi:hypothetical protein H5410_035990 [Solanum commersonii]|uniref:Uncharacterized protein n=1 Tax=Solanum commersonii TaxID=4109 RepID=A0A9J5Y6T7_SOLCO|nr:hypothetical protein H5410_035990 [Solanum commersonii]
MWTATSVISCQHSSHFSANSVPQQQLTARPSQTRHVARVAQIQRGKCAENIMEILANISKQVAEMNGRMGGMEERLVRVENKNRRKAIQPEYDDIRRASVRSTTLASGQAHNLCSPPQSQT